MVTPLNLSDKALAPEDPNIPPATLSPRVTAPFASGFGIGSAAPNFAPVIQPACPPAADATAPDPACVLVCPASLLPLYSKAPKPTFNAPTAACPAVGLGIPEIPFFNLLTAPVALGAFG